MNRNILYVVVLTTLLLTSCSITFEKRLYRKGYHVEVHNNNSIKHNNQRVETPTVKENGISPVWVYQPKLTKVQEKVEISSNPIEVIKRPSKKRTILGGKKDKPSNIFKSECDIITLKNGDEIEASVIKVSDTEIEYKQCNNPDVPTFIIKTSEIILIKYKNGKKYIPKNNSNESNNVKTEKGLSRNTVKSIVFAALFLISFVLGLLVGSGLFGFGIGIIALFCFFISHIFFVFAIIYMFCAIFIKPKE